MRDFSIIAVALFIMFSFSAAESAPKKKACNQLKITQCKKRTECSWVKKGKAKDGSEKKAYCRKKPKKKAGKKK